MSTILVTGGAGFIGSAVAREIITATTDNVVVVDKLTYAGNLMSLAPVAGDPRFAFEQVDICDRAELDRVFHHYQPDIVMHLAAESHVDRSIDGPASFIETNIVGTYTLLEAARAYWNTLGNEKKRSFASTISQRMRSMAICTIAARFLPKPRLMRPAVPIRPRKPAAIIWYGPGSAPTDCQRW